MMSFKHYYFSGIFFFLSILHFCLTFSQFFFLIFFILREQRLSLLTIQQTTRGQLSYHCWIWLKDKLVNIPALISRWHYLSLCMCEWCCTIQHCPSADLQVIFDVILKMFLGTFCVSVTLHCGFIQALVMFAYMNCHDLHTGLADFISFSTSQIPNRDLLSIDILLKTWWWILYTMLEWYICVSILTEANKHQMKKWV